MGAILGIFSFISNSQLLRTILKYFLIIAGSAAVGYYGGIKSAKYSALQDQLKQNAIALEIQKKQELKINDLTSKYTQLSVDDATKYEALKNENNTITDNLNRCYASAERLRIIYKSANAKPPASVSAGTNAGSGSGKPTDLSCADISATLIQHDKAYFECKSKLDFWQNYYKYLKP